MSSRPVLAIDAGTTGVTALVVGGDARVLGRGYAEVPQHFPRPGWVEHEPEEIWQAALAAAASALASSGLAASAVAALGITNQRETVVLWDRASLTPVHRALVWQDRRTAERCDALRGHEPLVRSRTGLVLDPYFSATKLEWLLREVPGLRARAERGELAFGTVDSWLVARLTGGAHVTDVSNASRTLLFDIYRQRFDDDLLDLFSVPRAVLPEVVPSSGRVGVGELLGARVPIAGLAGDQQAALFGQACFTPGMAKNTYGTGSFVLLNTGETAPPPPRGLLVTVAWSIGGRICYALEGAIFVTGAAVQWLRDGLGLIASAAEIEALAASVPDTGGVYFVPALTGLGSPWWDPYARGLIVGITRGTGRAHLARAALEAMAYQTRDVIETMTREAGVKLGALRVDGGAAVNDLLCQLQADQLGVEVRRPAVAETTALGAAFLAGLGEGVWSSTDDVARAWRLERSFLPSAGAAGGGGGEGGADGSGERDRLYRGWRRAVDRARGWLEPGEPSR